MLVLGMVVVMVWNMLDQGNSSFNLLCGLARLLRFVMNLQGDAKMRSVPDITNMTHV